MAGTPGCKRPTASQPSPEGPSASSGNVSPLQGPPVTFQLLWKAFQCCFRAGSGSSSSAGQAPAPRGTSSGLVSLPSQHHHSEAPAEEKWEKRWGFYFT